MVDGEQKENVIPNTTTQIFIQLIDVLIYWATHTENRTFNRLFERE